MIFIILDKLLVSLVIQTFIPEITLREFFLLCVKKVINSTQFLRCPLFCCTVYIAVVSPISRDELFRHIYTHFINVKSNNILGLK